MRYNSDGDEFHVDAVIDAGCKPVAWMARDEPAMTSPAAIASHDHLILPLGTGKYGIRFHQGEPTTDMELTGG